MYKLSISGLIMVFLAACAAKPTNPGAERIFVSNEEPAPDCIFMGEVQGSQGNFSG